MYDILITGASGFIGFNLLEKLKKKKIIVILKKDSNLNFKNVKLIRYDDMSELALKLKSIKTKIIIHCATHYTKNHQLNDIEKMMRANILLGNILLELSSKMRVKKFINISTIWELTSANSKKNLNLYTLTKKSFSKIIKFYSNKFKKIKFYNLYLSDTFGVNDKREKLLNIMKRKLYTGNNLIINSKNLIMNFLNIKDVINAILIVTYKNNLNSGDYLICNKKNYKIKEIIEKFNLLSNRQIKYHFLSQKKIDTEIPNIRFLPNWKIKHSKIENIINFIKG
jgi:nucleoside-diphosphate-sugar epimerase